MPYEQTIPVQPFRRIISGPSFVTIDGPNEDDDVYPPGRISDLRVEPTWHLLSNTFCNDARDPAADINYAISLSAIK